MAPGNPTITPISNTHTAPATTSVSISYDEAISPATVSTGTFAVHAVSHVDEGLELLSGMPAGAPGPDGRFPDGTFNGAVERAIEANLARLKELRD